MRKTCYKVISIACLLPISMHLFAAGMIDIKPYISTNIDYDDNIFRFSSPEQAKAVFGSSDTSDVVKRVDVGVNVNLRLDRQLLTVSSNINESRYDRFQILNNTGNANKITWNWRVGNDVYGELTASRNEAIAGFNEVKQPVKNLRTSSRQLASINWSFKPDWTLSFSRELASTENELASFNALDRDDDSYEAGIRYQNRLGTQLGVAYRLVDSKYLNRTGFTQTAFGSESTQKEVIVTAAWFPSHQTRISTRLAQVNLQHKDVAGRDFNGFSQRWNIDHSFTGKTKINLTAYQEVNAVDDVLSTYVRTQGFSINPTWNATRKISVQAGLGYEERRYLGSAANVADADRQDQSELANLSLTYSPTRKSIVQLQYQTENRTSDTTNVAYKFNNVNLLVRYDY